MSVSGYGIIGNRKLEKVLRVVNEDKGQKFLDASYLEDSALILASAMKRDGFLHPSIEMEAVMSDGTKRTFKWTGNSTTSLPRPLKVKEVTFRVDPGICYYFQSLSFDGLQAIKDEDALEFFRTTGLLITTRKDKLFTPGKLQRGIDSLRETLERKGYENAKVAVASEKRNDKTGAVDVVIRVDQGVKEEVAAVTIDVDGEGASLTKPEVKIPEDQPYSRLWTEDTAQQIRNHYYKQGFPDVSLDWEIRARTKRGPVIRLDLAAHVHTGKRVRVGKISFIGLHKTVKNVLRRRIHISSGDLFNPIRLDNSRFRLSQLGIFKSVDMETSDAGPHTRDVTYKLKEGKSIDVGFLMGYGSYERVRGGIEVDRYNLLGRGYKSRLTITESAKQTKGDYTLTFPEIFGENIDGSVQLYGLRRQEVSFVRREFGASFGARRYIGFLGADVDLTYNYGTLNSYDTLITRAEGASKFYSGSLKLEISRDRRDNPLNPRSGYRIYGSIQEASHYIGGSVEFQRIELGASWHHAIHSGLWVHAGLRHGILLSYGGPASNIPLNERFFMGGENSIRGYGQGQASPIGDNNTYVGAESYALVNLELEKAISRNLSLVLFSDSLFQARFIKNYPFDQELYSVGLSLRYQTIIGPARFGYGHNLNPRPQDPGGTWFVSLGYPF